MKVVFYTTEGCGICEDVLDLLFNEPKLAGLELVSREIADDAELVARFGETLPVLEKGGAVLHSPFTINDVLEWIET